LQHVAVADIHLRGKPGPGNQLAALTDLLPADVQPDDLAVDAGSVWASNACARVCRPSGKNPK